MAEKGKKSVTQKDVDGFVQYILTPQADLNALRRSGNFFKMGDENPDDNPLIKYYLGVGGIDGYNQQVMLLQNPKFAEDLTPLQIKTMSEALYFAINNPLIYDDPYSNPSMFSKDLPNKKIGPDYYIKNPEIENDVQSIYELFKAGDITRPEASSRISGLLSQSAAGDLPNIVFNDLDMIAFRGDISGNFMDTGIQDRFDARKDMSRILSTIDPLLQYSLPFSAFQQPEEVKRAGITKANNAMQILASFGYDRQKVADALGLSVEALDIILEGTIGMKEVYRSPELKEVPTQRFEGGEDIPGFSYYGVPGEGAMGYISPEGVRDDTISIMSNEELRRQAAQGLGTGLDPAGKVIYQERVYGTGDDTKYSYNFSPKLLEIISQNPDFSLQGLNPVDYGLEMRYLPKEQGVSN
tara:strand:+ start:431 stop:1663 length:1233 start_codon:yes stop_codon:yes gene_type:complete